MHLPTYLLHIVPLVCLVAHAQETPPIDAQKYHEALLKHPHNTTVFSRFYDAWIDAKSIESLETFLKQRAETHGATDYIILARYQLQRGQDPNALASLSKAIETLPNDTALLLERANLLIRTLQFDNARKDLEAITKLGNETLSIEANKLIGKSYLREGNPDAAIQSWEKILTTHPNNEDLLEDLVELASAAEQPEQALKYSEKLIAASTDPYKKALRLIRRGELLAKSNESDKAIALWSETLSQTGEGSWLEREILAFIEQSYRRLDRIDLLSSKLEELATAHPRRLLIHRELAKLEAASGNIDSAIGRFREVLRRSPNQPELREEFIRLLITSERFDDASAEIGKMLAITPNNPELHLRLAELAFQKLQLNPDIDKKTFAPEILKSLEKAYQFLDPTEASGLRIANLMIRYGLEENGENLLKQLSTKPNASTAPAEALATEYTRTKRPSKALEILTELSKSSEAETVLRATTAMAPLTKSEVPFKILLTRLPDFPNNSPYISALIQASLAAKKPTEAIPSALKLVRSSKLATEIQDATKLASAVITAAEKSQDIITELSTIETRSHPETCLLAALLEIQKNHEKSDALFATSTEPILLRFYSSLLAVRGDFNAAITTLNRLAESSADKSASYFKELSDLQLRAGDTEAALKTIEQWKIAAPTDKTPWTIATRLLRESGNSKEAIDTTRRALSRFSGDEDLTAILADLYQETGDSKEAERIFWKLYDQAPDTNAQTRWAARLANLAHKYGNTEELKDKFIQRSRSNNQSIGPILALVEIARADRNQESLLEHLYQALRIKPKDIDIRLQAASAEKQAGNLDKQMALLNEGIDQDTSGRIRTSLAQAFIDQGQVIKGMHMLRALNGERASDPRFIETAANSIASSGMIAEAIQYLEESLPQNPDWRTRFLIADLLQKDGRETEATTILLSLIEAKDEIPGLMPNSSFENFCQQKEQSDYYFQSLLSLVSQEIYNFGNFQSMRFSRHSSSGQQRALPASIEELHFRSKIQLAFIANLGNPALTEKITSANINELSLIADIISCHSDNGIDYLALLEKHPTNNDLIRMVVQQGRMRDPFTGQQYSIQKSLAVYNKLLESPTLDNEIRKQITISILQTDPKNNETWGKFFSLFENESKQAQNNLSQFLYQLQYLVAQHRSDIPAEHLPKIKEILFKNASSNGLEQELAVFALFGEVDSWIDAINKFNTEQKKQLTAQVGSPKKEKTNPSDSLARYGFNPQLPQLRNLPLTSVSIQYFQNIASDKFDPFTNNNQGSLSAQELIKKWDRLESPVFKAWIAIIAGDQKAINKTLAAKPSDIEINDFAILKIYLDTESKKYPEACRALIKLSKSPASNEYQVHWAETTFIAITSEIPADKRTEFLITAREIIDFYAPVATQKSFSPFDNRYASLLNISQKLGFDDLVAKFTPANSPQIRIQHTRHPVPSKIKIGSPVAIITNTSNPNKKTQRPLNAIDRLQIYSSEGKNTAAAHELLNHIETQKKQGYEISYILSNIKLTDPVRKEILSISDPGKNQSLSKRLRFTELCLALNESDTALTILRALSTERPFDTNISLQLAFSLPENEIDTAVNLLKKSSDSSAFYTILNSHIQRIRQTRNNSASFHYFNLLTKYLEIADPDKFNHRSLSEINSQVYYFFSGSNLTSIPSLIKSNSSAQKDTPEILKHREISRRLVTAMLRHPLLAESGFRLTRAANWIEDPAKIDELARNTLLIETQLVSRSRNESGNFKEFSSASWLCDRINQAKFLNEIIPADVLTSIEKNDPNLCALLKSFHSIKSPKDIAAFWDSGAMQNESYQTSTTTIQAAVLTKISTIPGATEFFTSRIKKLSQKEILNSRSSRNGEFNHILFIRAALESCKNQNETTVNNLCKTIIHAIYGENFNFTFNNDTNSQEYQIINRANSAIDSIFNGQTLDPVTAIRVFQAFDTHRVPLQNHYWIQNIFQNTETLNPENAITFLESVGFLKDTNLWKPLAYSNINHDYDRIANTSKYSITRVFLTENILQRINYRIRTKEFIKLLEERKPQTFGNLVTAAMLTDDMGQRERIMLKAFKHAAPQLAKASSIQLEDFNLLTPFLPTDAIDTLPQKLQTKIKERNAEIITRILKTIEQRFDSITQDPTQIPFGQIQNEIIELAQYDIDKSVETFLRANTIFTANLGHYRPENTRDHEEALHKILEAIGSNNQIKPENAIRFYKQIRNSPHSSSFGAFSAQYNSNSTFLETIGKFIQYSFREELQKDTTIWLRPWISANLLPTELHNDALAAATCYTIKNSNMINLKYGSPALARTEGLSEETRKLAVACANVVSWQQDNPESIKLSEQALLSILNNPIFNQDARRQIALSATRFPHILSAPAVAETYANIFTELSKEDRSVVSNQIINIMISFSNLSISEETKPHLKKISEAFWNNANSPKSGGHRSIDEKAALSLFLFAVKSGDAKNTEFLLPKIRGISVGNVNIITSLILENQFDLADELLPNDGAHLFNVDSFYHSLPLIEKLDTFATKSKKSEQILRLECFLIKMYPISQYSGDLATKLQTRKEQLYSSYQKISPKSPQVRSEILAAIHTGIGPAKPELQKEICEVAALLNTQDVISTWYEKYSTDTRADLPEEAPFKIICSAAMANFIDGKPELFNSTCEALTKLLQQSQPKDTYKLQAFIQPFIQPALLATAQAVAENKTQSFPKILPSLQSLIVEIPKHPDLNNDELSTSLAIYDFISHWENQPNNTPELLKKIKSEQNESLTNSFKIPRKSFLFFDNYRTISQSHNLARMGDKPTELVSAILSRESLANIYVISNSWLTNVNSGKVYQEVMNMGKNPPESASPSGKAYLRYHAVTRDIHTPEERITVYQILLKDMPDTPTWHEISINSKLQLIRNMSRLPTPSAPEMRAVFDSIDPKNISPSSKDSYEIISKEIIKAESITE